MVDNCDIMCSIDVTFDQDWSRLLDLYRAVHDKWRKGRLPNHSYNDEIKIEQYTFGTMGAMSALDPITVNSCTASFLHGDMIEKHLPWAQRLRNDMEVLKLSSLCLFQGNEDILEHRDTNKETGQMSGMCKLNHVISETQAVICMKDDNDKEYQQPARIGGSYLMDVTNRHWVKNNGSDLYLLQLCFDQPFEMVRQWFQEHPGLIYSNDVA